MTPQPKSNNRARNDPRRRDAVGVPKQEAKLHRLLLRALCREQTRKGEFRLICSEIDAYNGIADVITATSNGRKPFAQNLRIADLQWLNVTSARIMAQLQYGRRMKLADLASSAGLSQRTVSIHVARLQRLGILRRTRDEVTPLRSTKVPFRDITAFEVKVADWQHGLYQATHYKAFANRVALVLPDDKARRVAKRGKLFFTMFGVGLVGIRAPGILHWYLRPRFRKPLSHAKALLGSFQILKTRAAKPLLQHGRL